MANYQKKICQSKSKTSLIIFHYIYLKTKCFIRFGAGSEFGREARQEARKRRYGGNKKVSESSPWLLKVGGKKCVFYLFKYFIR